MTFRDAIWIDAPSYRVWECLGSPDLWPQIFSNGGSCRQLSVDGGVKGSRYELKSERNPRAPFVHCEVLDLRPGTMLALKWTMEELIPDEPMPVARSVYELTGEGVRTKVTERMEMTDSRNFLAYWTTRIIAMLLNPILRLMGRTCLKRLKRVVEGIS